MRGITVLLGLSLAILAGPPARADEAAALTLTPADQPLELTSLSTVTGSIAHAPLHLAGDVATGGISLAGLDAATGGINVVQLDRRRQPPAIQHRPLDRPPPGPVGARAHAAGYPRLSVADPSKAVSPLRHRGHREDM